MKEFKELIVHICYGVGVGALEVDVPEFGDDFAGLGLKVLGLTLMELAVDIIVGIAQGVYDPR